MPLANVPQNALAFHAVRSRRFSVGVRVIMVPGRRVAKPRESGKPLALSQHIRRHARLPRRQRLYQQIALQLGDARPILHIAVEIRGIDTPVLRRQTRDGALQVADARKMLVQASPIVARELFLQPSRVLANDI